MIYEGLRILFEPPRLLVSVHGPQRLHSEPLKVLNFAFPETDPAFHPNADPDLQKSNESMRIRIRNPRYTHVLSLPIQIHPCEICPF
jgi:hypothetical protein